MNDKELIKRVVALFEKKQLSQHELAKMVGVSQATVSEWLAGKITPKGANIRALAKALGTTSAYLLDGKGAETQSPGELKESVDSLKDSYIRDLEERIKELKATIADKNKIIELMNRQ